nr:MAG: RNA dependent RNA polymerase [Leviviridae sp.]
MGYINPDLLSDLLSEDLGPIEHGMLVSDMSLEDARKLWLANSFLKKFEDRESPDAQSLAINKFLAYNAKCASFRLEPKRLFDEEVIGTVKTVLDDWLHPNGSPAGLSEFFELGELGPGSSAKTESTHFYTKMFDSGLSTANEDLRVLYREAVKCYPLWSSAEEARARNHGYKTVTGSFTSTVPKQFDIRRTICTEPVLEMFFQRGIGNFVESVMQKRLGLDLAVQPDKNREFARIGSVDGSYGTIDLRSASDSISITLVKEVFPRYFVDWLLRTRCKGTTLPDGSFIELHMISSMGNGFTFALQTMLFAAIVVACYRLKAISPRFCRRRTHKGYLEANCGVFGDDIVVRREAYDHVVHCLTLFGFEVNDDKSFNSGNFRESCGEDYFRGVNIRGVYLKTLATEQDCYSGRRMLLK